MFSSRSAQHVVSLSMEKGNGLPIVQVTTLVVVPRHVSEHRRREKDNIPRLVNDSDSELRQSEVRS